MTVNRRRFTGAAAGVFAFTVGGRELLLSPREARAAGAAAQVLSAAEAGVLAAFGDTLVEGAAEAGLVQFVDQQLGVPANDCLLGARFFNVPPPYAPFYQAGLRALDAHARDLHGEGFAALGAEARSGIAAALAAGDPEGWRGPPASLLYLLVRSDAVDCVWGTPAGFEQLGIPYMAHIAPPSKW